MHITDAQIVKAVRIALKRLGAELAGSDAAHLVGLIEIGMAELAARNDGRPEALRREREETVRLARRAGALVAPLGIHDDTGSLPPATHGTVPADPSASHDATRRTLTDHVLALNAAVAAGRGDAAWRADVKSLFLDVARLDTASALELGRVEPLETDEEAGPPVAERLSRYFASCAGSARLPGPFEVLEIKPAYGGFSRQTIRVRARDARGQERRLVVRKQVPGGFLDDACNTLAEELPFHRLAHDHGLPVPEPYWHETDASHLGADFVVMSFAEGEILGASYSMAKALDEGFFRQLADILARMHRIDWSPCEAQLRASSRIPADAPTDARHSGLAMVEQFDAYRRAAGVQVPPALELVIDWLKRNVPRTDRRVVLCHADIGFHNLLVKDGRVAAVLDWETARLADPARELAYVHSMVTHYVPWEHFMGWYVDAGGQPIDQASLDYYALLSKCVAVITTEVAMGDRFPRQSRPDLEYMRLGWSARSYLFNEMLRDGWPIWGG